MNNTSAKKKYLKQPVLALSFVIASVTTGKGNNDRSRTWNRLIKPKSLQVVAEQYFAEKNFSTGIIVWENDQRIYNDIAEKPNALLSYHKNPDPEAISGFNAAQYDADDTLMSSLERMLLLSRAKK